MFKHRFNYSRRIAIGLVSAVCLVALRVTSTPSRFTPFVPTVVPQQAVGDFDGDGRADVARIQPGVHGSVITVHLSDSQVTTQLDANVSALVERDLDDDGDLDLVATTPTGGVLVWINDGHGEFSQQEPQRPSDVAGATLVRAGQTPSAAVTIQTVALPLARARGRRLMAATRIRPPTVESASSRTLGLLPPFRGPPTLHS
jgi:hypothetical protein